MPPSTRYKKTEKKTKTTTPAQYRVKKARKNRHPGSHQNNTQTRQGGGKNKKTSQSRKPGPTPKVTIEKKKTSGILTGKKRKPQISLNSRNKREDTPSMKEGARRPRQPPGPQRGMKKVSNRTTQGKKERLQKDSKQKKKTAGGKRD